MLAKLWVREACGYVGALCLGWPQGALSLGRAVPWVRCAQAQSQMHRGLLEGATGGLLGGLLRRCRGLAEGCRGCYQGAGVFSLGPQKNIRGAQLFS